jgi:lysyl-tRNA synthetase class 2
MTEQLPDSARRDSARADSARAGGGRQDRGPAPAPHGDESPRRRERRLRRSWVPRAAAWVIGVSGVLNIVSVFMPKLSRRLDTIGRYLPTTQSERAGAASAAVLFAGVLLLLLTRGLRRRKQRAYLVTIAVLFITAIAHSSRLHHIGAAIVSLVLLAGLLAYRSEFYAASDPRTRWGALALFVTLAPASVVLGLALLFFRSRSLVGPHPFSAELEHVLLGLIGIDGPLQFRGTGFDRFLSTALFVLGVLTGLTTLYLILRPAEPLAHLDSEDERRLRELLAKHGACDSLGYFALRRDKAVLWSATGKSAITYRVVSGVMLASGDPIGDPEAWPGAIKVFLDEADRHAWVPAVIGCSERAAEVWSREGDLDALEFGDEAVVEVAHFSLDGRPMRNVRQMVNRVERASYTATVCRVRDLPAGRMDELRQQASSWASTETERGFSMALGRLGDPADGECVIAVASLDDHARATLHFVPWGQDGLSLDLMRRDRTAHAGLNEFLIVETFKAAERLGFTKVSLNFAVFRSALERGERIGAGPILRAWRGLLVFLSRWFQIETLYKFNAKLMPEWQPRFVCFPSMRDVPRIAIAALEAEAFLNWPKFSWHWLRPWRRAFQRGA